MKKPTQKKKKRGSRKRSQSSLKANLRTDQGLESTESVAPVEIKKKVVSTIPKKDIEKKVDKKEPGFRYVNIAVQFLKEAKVELKKVKWPTRKELLASTAMVIFLVLAVSFFLALIDFGLIKVIRKVMG